MEKYTTILEGKAEIKGDHLVLTLEKKNDYILRLSLSKNSELILDEIYFDEIEAIFAYNTCENKYLK